MKNLIIILVMLFATVSFGQIPKTIFYNNGRSDYKSKDFSVSKRIPVESAGVYVLSESEGEWDFIVLPFKGQIIIQLSCNKWGKDIRTGKMTWLREFRTFNVVTTKGSNFQFGRYKGIFADYTGKIKKAILLNSDPPSNLVYGADTAQVGNFEMDLATYFEDRKYPDVSLKIIDEKYLAGKSENELIYMRNEVFAMYGQIFQSAEVAALFNKHYTPWRKDAASCLTDIEKHNLTIIRAYEHN